MPEVFCEKSVDASRQRVRMRTMDIEQPKKQPIKF